MSRFRYAWLPIVVSWCSVISAADTVESLTRYLPPESNGLAIVRVAQLQASPRGVREQWSQHASRFLAGADTIPHWVEAFAMGVEFQLGKGGGWSAAVVPLPAAISFDAVAKQEGATVQALGGAPAAYARGSYYLEVSPRILGVMSPASRLDAARWARYVQSSETSALTPYLQQVAKLPDQIVLALDMQDMLDPQVVAQRLESSPSLKGDAELIAAMRKAISSLAGIAFRANIQEETVAQISFDFSEPLPDAATVLRDVFLEVLSEEQMVLEEIRSSSATIRGNSLVLTMKLSDVSLRRIMSLVLSPHPRSASPTPPVNQPPETDAAAAADQRKRLNRSYYASINRTLKDLQRQPHLSRNRVAETAGWLDRAAQKINNMSIQGIDPELTKYASTVTSKLLAIASSLQGMAVSVNAAQSTLTYQFQTIGGWGGGWGPRWGGYGRGGYGGWGAVVPSTNLGQVRDKQAQAVTESEADRQKIWQSLEADHAAIRELMLQRYDEDFDQAIF